MASNLSIRGLLRPLSTNKMQPVTSMLRTTTALLSSSASTPTSATSTSSRRTLPKMTTTFSPSTHRRRAFTTTPSLPARAKPKAAPAKGGAQGKNKVDNSAAARKKRRAMAAAKLDPKTANIMKFIYAGSQARAPLRMARNRYLRHWVIHRAWLLHRRKQEEARETEMMRLQASMAYACEKLRTMAGPGTRPEGYLYRKAMAKTGLWAPEAIPIQYARPLVETPGEKPWNHEWKKPKE